MAIKILMPQLGLTMVEGTIVEWRKKEGEPVKKGEVLFLVENDKSTVEVEAQADGLLARIEVTEQVTVPVGSVVGWIAAAGEKLELIGEAAPATAAVTSAPPATVAPAAAPSTAAAPDAKRFIPASPRARALAREKGIDLSRVKGSGPEGSVLEKDVRAGGQAVGPTPAAGVDAPYEDLALSRIQVVAAERMVQSWTTIPQFTLTMETDAEALLGLQERYRGSGDSPATLTILMAGILARVLLHHPRLNSSWLPGGRVRAYRSVHVGIALDTPEGLMVPVLRDCEAKGFRQLASEWKALVERVRDSAASSQDLSGGTISLSNLGMFGVGHFRAIVNPPQAAILAVGAIARRMVPGRDGPPVLRPLLPISLSADHRVVDGAAAARFLKTLKEMLEHPVNLYAD